MIVAAGRLQMKSLLREFDHAKSFTSNAHPQCQHEFCMSRVLKYQMGIK